MKSISISGAIVASDPAHLPGKHRVDAAGFFVFCQTSEELHTEGVFTFGATRRQLASQGLTHPSADSGFMVNVSF